MRTNTNEISDYQQLVMYRQFLKLNMPTCRIDYINSMPKEIDGKPIRDDVISFLAGLLYNNNPSPIDVALLFRCGYCYHLAVILQSLFGGSIVIDTEAHHVYWKDDDTGLLYDINGVCEISNVIRYTPIEKFKENRPEDFDLYLHIYD